MTIYLNAEVRRQMLQKVRGLFPFTPSYQLHQINRECLNKHSKKVIPHILKQIVKDPDILSPNTLNIGYTIKEMVGRSPSTINIPIPDIYCIDQSIMSNHTANDTQGTPHQFLELELPQPTYLPNCHFTSIYLNGGRNLMEHNKIKLEGKILNLYIEYIEHIHKELLSKIEDNNIIAEMTRLLPLFKTTKQLINHWPEMEHFLPNNKVHKAMDQKKAKPIPLTKHQTKLINKINKQIFIRRLTTTNGV